MSEEFAALKFAIQASLSDFSSKMGEMEKILKGQEQQVQKTKASWLDMFTSFASAQIATNALGKLQNLAVQSINDYDKMITTLAKLKMAVGEHYKAINEYAEARQKVTRNDSDAYLAAAQTLSIYKLSGDEIMRLLPVLEDAGEKYGGIEQAARAFGTTIMTGNSRALRPWGITIKENLTPQERYNYLLENGAKNVKGLAEEMGKLGTGPMVRVNNELADQRKEIGAQLIPVWMQLASFLQTYIVPLIKGLIYEFKVITATIVAMSAGVGAVFTKGKGIRSVFSEMQAAFNYSLNKQSEDYSGTLGTIPSGGGTAGVDGIDDTKSKPKQKIDSTNPELVKMQEALETYKAMVQQSLAIVESEFKQNKISIDEYYDTQIQALRETSIEQKKVIETELELAKVNKDEVAVLKLTEQLKRIDIELGTQIYKIDSDRAATLEKNNSEMQRALVLLKQAQREQSADEYDSRSPMSRLKRQQDKELEGLLTQLDKLMELRDKDGVDRVALEETIAGQINLINKRSVQYSKELAEEEMQYKLSLAVQTGDQLVTLFNLIAEKQGSKGRAMWEMAKHAAAVMAVVHGIQGYTRTISELGLPWGAIIGLPALGIGVAQAAIIESKKYPEQKAESGGLVRGRRHTSGGVIIEAEDNEFVMQRKAVQYYGVPFMRMINSAGMSRSMVPAFANGGPVSSPAAAGSRVSFTNVNIVDPALVSSFLSSEEGKNAVVNVIKDKAFEVSTAIGARRV